MVDDNSTGLNHDTRCFIFLPGNLSLFSFIVFLLCLFSVFLLCVYFLLIVDVVLFLFCSGLVRVLEGLG